MEHTQLMYLHVPQVTYSIQGIPHILFFIIRVEDGISVTQVAVGKLIYNWSGDVVRHRRSVFNTKLTTNTIIHLSIGHQPLRVTITSTPMRNYECGLAKTSDLL